MRKTSKDKSKTGVSRRSILKGTAAAGRCRCGDPA